MKPKTSGELRSMWLNFFKSKGHAVIPSASVWMPFGKPVNGSMKGADLDFFRRVKEMLGELYVKYHLEPAGCCGLNVGVERDIRRWATGAPCC